MRRGFTLLEILVAVTIVSLITVLSVAGYSLVRQRSRDTQRVSQIADLQKSLGLYINEVGTYPVQAEAICLNGADAVSTALLNQKVLAQAVRDPLRPNDIGFCYEYNSNAEGSGYTLKYFLETTAVQPQGQHIVTN